MALWRAGRSVLVLTLVFGLVTVWVMPATRPDAFAISPPEYNPLADRGTGCFVMASLQRRHCAQIGNDIGEAGVFEAGIKDEGQRRHEEPARGPHFQRDVSSGYRRGSGRQAR